MVISKCKILDDSMSLSVSVIAIKECKKISMDKEE
jgi:hypothetical protein